MLQSAMSTIRAQGTGTTVKDDARLRDVFIYFLGNGATSTILSRTFYEKLEMSLQIETSEKYVPLHRNLRIYTRVDTVTCF
jgi:hypothetical protein